MHIVFLTDNFPPEVNAPASRTYDHCREWVRAGHHVTVITGVPNFPKGIVFPGYRNRLWQVEWMDGIRVIRVWTYLAANEGFGRRILDYASFMVSGTLAGLFVRPIDVVIGTSPQLFTVCAASLVSRLRRRPFVFELRDLWPESIEAVGALKASWLLRVLAGVARHLYRHASAIVAVTQSFAEALQGFGIVPEKIHVITNGADLERYRPRPKAAQLVETLGLAGRFVIGYIGTHGLAHGLETLLEGAERLRALPDGERFRLLFLGDGARKAALQQEAVRRRLDSVIWVDTVPKQEVARYWSLLDAAVIHLRDTPVFRTVIPSKLFEAMAMGIPILHGVEGESARIVEREGCGLTFAPGDAAGFANAVVRLAGDPVLYERCRANARRAAERYDRRRLARDMLSVLLAVAGRTVLHTTERSAAAIDPS